MQFLRDARAQVVHDDRGVKRFLRNLFSTHASDPQLPIGFRKGPHGYFCILSDSLVSDTAF